MQTYKSDFETLKEILSTYIVGDNELKKAIIPATLLMTSGKFFLVQSANLIKKLSTNFNNSSLEISSLLYYSGYTLTGVLLTQFASGWLCKFGQKGFRIANGGCLNSYLNLHPLNYNKHGTGELQSNIKRRADSIKDTIDVATLYLFPFLISTLFVMINIFMNMGIISLIVLLTGIFLYLYVTIRITEFRNNIRTGIVKSANNNQNLLFDILNNYDVIFSSANEEYETERYTTSLKITENQSTKLSRSLYLLNWIQESIWHCTVFLLLLVNLLFNNSSIISELGYILSIVALVKSSLFNIGFMFGKYKSANLYYNSTKIPTIVSKNVGGVNLEEFDKSLDIYNLTLCHQSNLILDNVSLNIYKGEKVAIIGHNGTGKSTFLKSILKMNGADGQVFIDEFNSEDISNKSFRKLVNYIPQNANLFDETIKYNIKYNKNKVFDEQIIMLAKKIGLHEDLIKLQQGYNTDCGENGNNLSGGEKQKVLILRAFISQSPILVLDEPTAAIDEVSEDKVMAFISTQKNLTVISTIHNLNLLKYFDKVYKVINKKLHLVKAHNIVLEE